jgi:hypothetical protein
LSIRGTHSKPNIPDMDNIEGIIFIPQAVEDITNFEAVISDATERAYVRFCGGCGMGEWTRSRPITYLSG